MVINMEKEKIIEDIMRTYTKYVDEDLDIYSGNRYLTVKIEGYTKAMKEALKILEEIAVKVDPMDRTTLRKIVDTAIASKYIGRGTIGEKLAEIAINAALTVAERKPDGTFNFRIDDVKIEKKKGGSVDDTQLVYGIVLDKEVVHPGMPRRVENAKIALIDAPLEVEKPEITAKINITSPDLTIS